MKELRAHFVLISLIISGLDAQCASDAIPSSLSTLSQYQIGTEGDAAYSHFLVAGGASFTFGNDSATAIYDLSASAITAATSNCTASCLTSVTAYYKTDSDKLTIMMLRPSDEALYPNYTSTGFPPFLCATVSESCGATVPLYQFYSSTFDDYYADVEQRNNTNATYTVAMMGLPLCYLWVPLTTTTTTTTTTTSPLNSTTTTVPSNGTTTTVPLNSTTTTISPVNGTNATTTVPSNSTTTTVPSNVTTTTVASGNVTTTTVASTGNGTTTTSSSGNSTSPEGSGDSDGQNEEKGEKKGWWHTWRWPIIVVGCLLGAALVLSLITCLTCCFIGPATVAAKPYSPPPVYSSPTPGELPPQPIDAPAVQPFTVGLPPTVPY